MPVPVFRFAPSPNGRLHLGHAYCALLNARLAAQSGGRFLLRIEDIDNLSEGFSKKVDQSIFNFDSGWIFRRSENLSKLFLYACHFEIVSLERRT